MMPERELRQAARRHGQPCRHAAVNSGTAVQAFNNAGHRPQRNRPCNCGVTLVELLAVVAVLGMMAAMLTFMFGSMDRSYRNVDATLEVYQKARVTLARISRELSGALFEASGTLGLSGTAGDISFHTTIDTDAFTADAASSDIVAVRYALGGASGKTLIRYTANADATSMPALPLGDSGRADMADGVTALSFEYFESAGDFYGEPQAPQPGWDSGPGARGALPALVRIGLTVQDEKQLAPPRTFTDVVGLRNAS